MFITRISLAPIFGLHLYSACPKGSENCFDLRVVKDISFLLENKLKNQESSIYWFTSMALFRLGIFYRTSFFFFFFFFCEPRTHRILLLVVNQSCAILTLFFSISIESDSCYSSTVSCNCNINDNTPRRDVAIYSNRDHLPLTSAVFRQAEFKDSRTDGKFTVGPLECKKEG